MRIVLFAFYFFFSFLILGVFNVLWGQVFVLPQEGELYQIAEKDALEEIEERAKKVNMKALWQRLEERINLKLKPNYFFQKACVNRTFEYIPYYTLPFDIKVNGTVLYPKGFTFNPLEYIHPIIENYTIIFFDGSSEKEVNWLLKENKLNSNSSLLILIAVKGDIRSLSKRFGRPIYSYDPQTMEERFKIRRTPSLVRFKGGKVIVTEVGIYKCKK